MKQTCVAIVALLSFSSATWASAVQSRPPVSRAEIERAATASMSLNPADRYVRNANSCQGEQARAVWSRDDVLLGYGCYNNSNGG